MAGPNQVVDFEGFRGVSWREAQHGDVRRWDYRVVTGDRITPLPVEAAGSVSPTPGVWQVILYYEEVRTSQTETRDVVIDRLGDPVVTEGLDVSSIKALLEQPTPDSPIPLHGEVDFISTGSNRFSYFAKSTQQARPQFLSPDYPGRIFWMWAERDVTVGGVTEKEKVNRPMLVMYYRRGAPVA